MQNFTFRHILHSNVTLILKRVICNFHIRKQKVYKKALPCSFLLPSFTDFPSKLQNSSFNRWRPEYPEEAFLLPRKVFQQELWKFRKTPTPSKNNHHDRKQIKVNHEWGPATTSQGLFRPLWGHVVFQVAKAENSLPVEKEEGDWARVVRFLFLISHLISFVELC